MGLHAGPLPLVRIHGIRVNIPSSGIIYFEVGDVGVGETTQRRQRTRFYVWAAAGALAVGTVETWHNEGNGWFEAVLGKECMVQFEVGLRYNAAAARVISYG
ncbi:hypothetical protein E2562_003063 [Oryza meyeriana var. granulata]|uniref:Uncharacterized protein n=1 Tax=Oryza meyeriana var. granulata TaxID=110450 RepID=A0A6G1E9Z7_9ORYZ|nr:hypothetical protein E2562_003063 [Oryza meyeriana var. granulata]